MGTDLNDWIHFLDGLTPETVILPGDCTNEEIDATIWYFLHTPAPPLGYRKSTNAPKKRERTAEISGVFVRLTQVSPKRFSPCKNSTDVRLALLVDRTAKYRGSPICIRRWLPNIRIEYVELRCFISYNKCTGISQNDSQCDSEPLEEPETIKKLALDFLEVVRPRLKGKQFENCTIDIAINKKTHNCIVIEINSSHRVDAGTGLFSEYSPADMAQLDFGAAPTTPLRYYSDMFGAIEEI